jgi:hypothetical protein
MKIDPEAFGLRDYVDPELSDRDRARARARAAIEDMREPTPGMSVAGCPREDNSGAPYCYDRTITNQAYRAMIDAATTDV